MKIPPIEWADLVAVGLQPNSTISDNGGWLSVEPSPPKLVGQLLVAAMASPPPEDDRMAYLRHVRDLLMGCTDWTQANDSPLSPEHRAAWATYRQALRDLPSNYSGEGPIPWPVAP